MTWVLGFNSNPKSNPKNKNFETQTQKIKIWFSHFSEQFYSMYLILKWIEKERGA